MDTAETGSLHKGGHSQDKDQLKQVTEPYEWEKLKPSAFCSCFNFVLQLVLVGCCGSFLFGFNIALLNTAVNVVFSEFQLCGVQSGVVKHFVDLLKAEDKQPAYNFYTTYQAELEMEGCTANTDENYSVDSFKCTGGYNDLGCDSFKWYVAFIQTAVLIGGAVGALCAGRLVRYGRRSLLLIIMVIFSVGIVASMCANSFAAMMFARLIVGLGVGMVSVASPTYISEMTPSYKRGKYGVFHQLSITVGIFAGILIGLPLPDPSDLNLIWEPTVFTMFWWRFMLGIGITPVLLGIYMLLSAYTFESPIYYVEQNRYQDACNILERLYRKQDVTGELEVSIETIKAATEYKKKGLTLASGLKNPEYRLVLLVGLGLAGFQQFGGINVFMTSSSGLFKKAGLSKEWQTGMSILMAGINVLMTYPTIVLIERLGRKQLLFFGSLGQTIVLLPVAIAYWTESDPSEPVFVTRVLAIIAVVGFVVCFAVAFGPVVWVYLFEIFPMELKDKASALCTAFNWVAGIIMVFLANVLPNQVSFTLFAVLQIIATLFVWFFMKETKGYALGISPYITQREKSGKIIV